MRNPLLSANRVKLLKDVRSNEDVVPAGTIGTISYRPGSFDIQFVPDDHPLTLECADFEFDSMSTRLEVDEEVAEEFRIAV